MKKILLTLAMALMAVSTLMAVTADDIPNVHRADRTQYVSNPDGVLAASTVARLNERIGEIWRQTSCEVVVVALDSVGASTTPHDLAYEILMKWGVGKRDKNNGVVILLSRGDRRVDIVTGRGTEGVLPDIICGRISADVMGPYFAKGDYDAGMIAGVDKVGQILEDPDYAAELRSKYANDSAGDELDAEAAWRFYRLVALMVFVAMGIYTMWVFRSTRGMDLSRRYDRLRTGMVLMLVGSFVTLGLGFIILAVYWLMMRRLRTAPRKCPNCGTPMKRMSEDKDNAYLTPSQDLEERLKSVDYDVWVCPNCNEVDIIPFYNRSSVYKECPYCHAHACVMVADRIITNPTSRREGIGEHVYHCRNCGNDHNERYRIDPTPDTGAALAAGLAAGVLLGGRGGGGGGGFSGGSFGGGTSAGGGGGASW